MVTIKQDLNLPATGTVPPSIRVTQYDTAIKLIFTLYNGSAVYSKPDGGKAFISMTKSDNKIVHYECTFNDDGTVETQITQQMTAAAGEAYCKLVVTDSNGQVSSTSFNLIVQEAGAKDGGVISESDISDVEKVIESAEFAATAYTKIPALQDTAVAAVNAAQTEAVAAAKEQVDIAKSWAVGPSGSGSGSDTNNAKYYYEKAKTAVTGVTSFNGRTGDVTPTWDDYYKSETKLTASVTTDIGTVDGFNKVPSGCYLYENTGDVANTPSAYGIMILWRGSSEHCALWYAQSIQGVYYAQSNATEFSGWNKLNAEDTLSSTSTAPVQNKVVTEYIDAIGYDYGAGGTMAGDSYSNSVLNAILSLTDGGYFFGTIRTEGTWSDSPTADNTKFAYRFTSLTATHIVVEAYRPSTCVLYRRIIMNRAWRNSAWNLLTMGTVQNKGTVYLDDITSGTFANALKKFYNACADASQVVGCISSAVTNFPSDINGWARVIMWPSYDNASSGDRHFIIFGTWGPSFHVGNMGDTSTYTIKTATLTAQS